MTNNELTGTDPLNPLKSFTDARIALGRVGASVPLNESLGFKLAHAHARDAVYSTIAIDHLTEKLRPFELPMLQLHSQAANRAEYLKRPDLGRKLSTASLSLVTDYNTFADLVIIIADGLSATAVNEHTPKLLKTLIPMLTGANLKVGAICLVEQGRVAIGDDIGGTLSAKMSILLIGERPGLSSADSLGAYLTFGPRAGLTDESRNCVSNIRPGGLSFKPAAEKIFYLVQEAFRRKISGVALKDNAGYLNS